MEFLNDITLVNLRKENRQDFMYYVIVIDTSGTTHCLGVLDREDRWTLERTRLPVGSGTIDGKRRGKGTLKTSVRVSTTHLKPGFRLESSFNVYIVDKVNQ